MAAGRFEGPPGTAHRCHRGHELPLADTERSSVFPPHLRHDLQSSGRAGTRVRHAPGQAHPWIHVLLPALLAALRTLGAAPSRSLITLAQRLGVSEADAATVAIPLEEEPAPVAAAPAVAPAADRPPHWRPPLCP